jgi:uncharacterized protein involved in exopolysaccharide biosynthesis
VAAYRWIYSGLYPGCCFGYFEAAKDLSGSRSCRLDKNPHVCVIWLFNRDSSRGADLGTYVQLVKNPAIAEAVLEELGDRLDPARRNTGSLLDMVNGNLAEKSDAIEIIVRNRDPVLARDIANAWAKAYVDQVNAIYGSGVSQEPFNSIQSQTEAARGEYDKAQADLEAFLAESRTAQYERQIAERESIVDSLSQVIQMTAGTIISNTMASQLTVFNENIGNLSTQLADVYNESRRANQMLLDARNMRDQVQQGGPGAVSSNALALVLLKSQVFATNEGAANLIVQTSPITTTSQEMLTDLDSLIATLENRRTDLEGQVKALSNQLLNSGAAPSTTGSASSDRLTADQAQTTVQSLSQLRGLEGIANLDLVGTPMEQKIQQLEGQVNQLQANLAQEQGREQELTRARDLAWETYKTLVTKEAELKVASQTQGTEVALAAPAGVPKNDIVSGTRNVALAALVGLMLGIGAAYFIEFWWSYKGLQPQPITLMGIFRGIELKPVPVDKKSA